MDIVVVGSCNTDLISYVPRMPAPGETLEGSQFTIGFGGKGANQCVAASRLGASTTMVAKVGDDTFGHDYLKNFEKNKVNVEHVGITSEATTGVAPIAVSDSGQNAIIIVPGANKKLTVDYVKAAEDTIRRASVVVCQLEIDPQVSLAALRLAKHHGVTTVFNPAPAQSSLHPDMYTHSDYFCPNESEAALLTGLPVSSVSEAEEAGAILLARGCGTVIITLGGQGSLILEKEKKPVHVAAQPVEVVDTTGAGDAFIGSLAYYLACKPQLPLTEVVRRSGQIATVSVQRPGTQTSYAWQSDLDPELFK